MCKIILALLISLAFNNDSRSCGTNASDDEIIEALYSYKENKTQYLEENRELYWIPIQFHIIQHDNGSGGLNEIILPGVIDDLNMDYINANIRFYQYDAVDYILNSNFYSTDGDFEINELRLINNTNNVIDIYAVPNLSSDSGQLCGKSSFTWYGIQGIVIANDCFDRYTISHEVGHYFDLFHPHEDANGQEYVNGDNCIIRGDGICDTPADPKLNLDGMVSLCIYTGVATDLNGQEYDDCQGYDICELYGGPDTGNIMSYAPDDCVNHFSVQQYEKIEYILLNERPDYISHPDYVEYNVEIHSISDIYGDNDLVINPGEEIQLLLNININESWPVSANEIILTLNTNEEGVNIISDQVHIPYLNAGEFFLNEEEPFQIQFSANAELKDYNFNLSIIYLSENGNNHEANFDLDLSVSLNQFGFPFESYSTIKSSPIIIDLDGDFNNEIIFGSHGGTVYICESLMDGCIEFAADGQIWSSPAVADIDNDGELEVVFGSIDKWIYILNSLGELENKFYTDQFLVGTPALGNLDLDPELEIVVGGFSTSSNLFAFNHDLTLINNFPVEINEKIKEGVALADVDADGIDEIFLGTEDGNLYKVNHGGVLFDNNLIFTANDKIVFSPIIVKNENSYLVGFGSDDGNFYLLDSDGNIQFSYFTGAKIRSSASVIQFNSSIYFMFGSEDGFLYLIDIEGNDRFGWPVFIGEPVENAPLFLDLENDGISEIVVVADNQIRLLTIEGDFIEIKIENNYSITGSPVAGDLDLDGDLELFVGTNYDLIGIDLKMTGNVLNSWSMYRGNFKRTGFIDFSDLNNKNPSFLSEFESDYPFPNPFNGKINLPLKIDSPGDYLIKVFNLNGVQVLSEKKYFNSIGRYNFLIEFNDYVSGVYFIQYESNKSIKTSKIILLK